MTTQIEKPPEEAVCPKGGLHDYSPQFKTHAVAPGHKAVADRCRRCGGWTNYQIHKDRILGEEAYIRSHFRDFLQPEGPTKRLFIQEYGEEAYRRWQDSKKKAKEAEAGKSGTFLTDDDKKDLAKEMRTTVI
jgi:hypothetical protein